MEVEDDLKKNENKLERKEVKKKGRKYLDSLSLLDSLNLLGE